MSPLSFAGGTVAMAVVHLVAWMIGSGVFPPPLPPGAPVDPAPTVAAMGSVCLLHAALLGGLIRDRAARGCRLGWGVFLLFCGPMSLWSQIETAFFAPPSLPAGTAPIPAAVALFGGDRRAAGITATIDRPALRLALIAPLYTPIYLVFGYFVALRQPAIQHYYGLQDPGSFLAQLGVLATETPRIFPFQFARALVGGRTVTLVVIPANGI